MTTQWTNGNNTKAEAAVIVTDIRAKRQPQLSPSQTVPQKQIDCSTEFHTYKTEDNIYSRYTVPVMPLMKCLTFYNNKNDRVG